MKLSNVNGCDVPGGKVLFRGPSTMVKPKYSMSHWVGSKPEYVRVPPLPAGPVELCVVPPGAGYPAKIGVA
jgi:hypothetical protein